MANNQSSAGGRYDSGETIDYQLRQLPTEPALSRLAKEWKEAFPDLPTPVVKGQDRQLTHGLTNVLSWEINGDAHLNGAQVDYGEFGYDESGYVCKLHVGDRNHDGNGPIDEHMVSKVP